KSLPDFRCFLGHEQCVSWPGELQQSVGEAVQGNPQSALVRAGVMFCQLTLELYGFVADGEGPFSLPRVPQACSEAVQPERKVLFLGGGVGCGQTAEDRDALFGSEQRLIVSFQPRQAVTEASQ